MNSTGLTARQVAQADQFQAAARTVAEMTALARNEFVYQGFTDEESLRLATWFVHTSLTMHP